jgi:hypothetical protein
MEQNVTIGVTIRMQILQLASLALLVGILIPSVADAKRVGPPKVEPVLLSGVRYTAPTDNGRCEPINERVLSALDWEAAQHGLDRLDLQHGSL